MKIKNNNRYCEVRSNPDQIKLSSKALTQRARRFHGFTLVELIVVITILAILGTIGFVQMNGFASSARDSRRVSDMSNIQKAIELTIVTQGSNPVPTGAISYTGGTVGIQMGKADNISIPKMSGDFSDPLTKEAYNYSIFENGNYYQIGIDLENPLSYHMSIPGIETVYATDTPMKYSKLSGNYMFDPSLPSLFILSGSYNSASGGIFAPDVCFVVENMSSNIFGSNSGICVAKKDMNLKENDGSLVGYWDMESLTASGLLRDLSGNENNGTFSGEMVANTALTGGVVGRGMSFNGNLDHIEVLNSASLNPTNITISVVVNFYGNGINSNFYPRVLGKGATASEQYALWQTLTGSMNNHFAFRLYPETKNASQVQGEKSYNNINSFATLTATYNGRETKIFVNGKLDTISSDIFSGNILGYANNLIIGNTSWNSGLNRAFYGIIDDIKIYNRALSDSEIKQHAKIVGF